MTQNPKPDAAWEKIHIKHTALAKAQKEKKGDPLLDSAESLHRNVYPHHYVQETTLSSAIFEPRPTIDKGKVSVYRGKVSTAEEAYFHYLGFRPGETVGVLSVTIEDLRAVEVDEKQALPAICSPSDRVPAHSSIDFNKLPKKDENEEDYWAIISNLLVEIATKKCADGFSFQP